jgi:restriction system protein
MSIFALLVLIAVAVIIIISWSHEGGVERSFFGRPRPTKYFEFQNVIVRDDRGSTEIDVVVVSNAGVFVIELKDFNAWVFGEEDAERWTACYLDKSRHPFQNPLRQNFRHIKALEARLRLNLNVFHSIVAFTGKCVLKTSLPDNVIVGGYRTFLERYTKVVLTDDDVRRICDILGSIEAASDNVALEQHVAELKERFGSDTVCPKCGSALVERRSKAEWNKGEPFLGCKGYPRCKFIKKLGAT